METPDAPSMTIWTFSSTHRTLSSNMSPVPSTLLSTTLTSARTLCVTLRTSARAIRASSCVNLSSFLRASSRSVLPASFFTKLSRRGSATVHGQPIGNSLADPRLSSFVAIPNILSTSTIISVLMSVIAVVGVTSVYVSSRLKKNPIRSNSSARTSLLAATSLAVWKT